MAHHVNGLLTVTPLPGVVADPAALKAGYNHKLDNGKLFPHVPTSNDVKQGAVGDCYYLAAALAILAKPAVAPIADGTGAVISGAEFIESMMKDHGDQTVTVRFMKKDVHGAYQPDYVRVRKTFVHNANSRLFNRVTPPRAQESLWVKVLEKAWAAWINGKALQLDYFEQIAANKGPGTSPDNALACLLGADTQNLGLRTQDALKLPWGGINPSGLIGAPSPSLQQRIADIQRDIFNNDATLTGLWMTFLKNNAADIFFKAEFRREDFENLAQTRGMPPALKNHLDTYFDGQMLLPGKRGTGIYTQEQLGLFGQIHTALQQRKVIELTARPQVGIADRAGHSSGEPVVRGLVGLHAFAVLGTKSDTTPPQRRWIKIRNPWGDTGRRYVAHPTKPDVLKAAEQQSGEYWLELADLTKRFQSATIGGLVRSI